MKKKFFVRWLGAFGKGESLHTSLEWELSQRVREVASEPISSSDSGIRYCRVGLLSFSAERVFKGDVWSIITSDRIRGLRRLKATRAASPFSYHGEAFVRPEKFCGLVVRGRLAPKVFKTVVWFARRHKLPIYNLQGSELKEVRNL